MVLNNLSSIIIFIYFCSVAGDPRQHVSQASTLLLSHTPSLCGTLITVLRQAVTFFFNNTICFISFLYFSHFRNIKIASQIKENSEVSVRVT